MLKREEMIVMEKELHKVKLQSLTVGFIMLLFTLTLFGAPVAVLIYLVIGRKLAKKQHELELKLKYQYK